MSDGPWKSLPLRSHWKQVAKRLENDAFTLEERRDHLKATPGKEAGELPLEAVFRTVMPNGQGHLFGPNLTEVIETLRRDHPGSQNAQTFLTCLSDQEGSPASGRDIVESAVADTLEDCLLAHSRSIEEHYLRRNPVLWERVEPLLDAARQAIDIRGLASRIVADSGSSARAHHPPKCSGLDEGPQL